MLKEKYLNPVINFLKKFGKINIQELKKQAKKSNYLKIKVNKYKFYFIYSNGWRLIAIGE